MAASLVPFEKAASLIDEFETLLLQYGISIPSNQKTSADMLSVWRLLQYAQDPKRIRPHDPRELLRNGAAAHDLAAKVLEVRQHRDFEKLLPHLKLLSGGAIALNS